MGVDSATDYAKSLFVEAKEVIDDSFMDKNALNALAEWLWQRQK